MPSFAVQPSISWPPPDEGCSALNRVELSCPHDEPFGHERGITGIVPTAADDDRDLIRRAREGDLAAFEGLAAREAERLFRCAWAMSHDRHLAEDLTQETLVEAWRSLGRFDGRCRFSTWLYGILRHRLAKSRRRRRPAVLDPAELLPAGELTEPGLSPAQAAQRSEDAACVRKAVASLSDEHRLVIELRFFAGARLDEIAAAVGCPLGTVKSRLHHGLEKLRQAKLRLNLFEASGESTEREP